MRRGFTLIELLIAIAIIGMLTAIALASFSVARTNARDARRIDDIGQIQKALALYLISNNTFPISVATSTLDGNDSVSAALISSGEFSASPRDPGAPVYEYSYSSSATGNSYILSFCLETETIPNYNADCSNVVTP